MLHIARQFSVAPIPCLKFIQFAYNSIPNVVRAGCLQDDYVVDLSLTFPTMPRTMLGILQYGCLEKVFQLPNNRTSVPLNMVQLKAPIHGMDKIVSVGYNRGTPPDCINRICLFPSYSCKFGNSVIDPNVDIKLRSDVAHRVDWDVQLAIVIGKEATRVRACDALYYVMGCTVAQDITGRDFKKERDGRNHFLDCCSADAFCPLGPWIVTMDEISRPEKLIMKCYINGQLRNSSNLCKTGFRVCEIIESITHQMTLLPGDLILTGTPRSMNCFGFVIDEEHKRPEYLKPGDVIISFIEGIGILETHFVY